MARTPQASALNIHRLTDAVLARGSVSFTGHFSVRHAQALKRCADAGLLTSIKRPGSANLYTLTAVGMRAVVDVLVERIAVAPAPGIETLIVKLHASKGGR